MEILFSFIPLLVLAALVAGVVYGIRTLTRRREHFEDADPGLGTVRRLYFYLVSFVALMMAANGVTMLIAALLEALFGGPVLSGSGSSTLALGIALVLVGIPLWAFHWRLVTRYLREMPVESRSVIRKIYIYGLLLISASFVIGLAIEVVREVLDQDSFRGYPLAAVLVWAGVWAYHWRLETQEGQPTPETRAVRRLYVYPIVAATLAIAAVGLGQLLHVLLREAYEGLVTVGTLNKPGAGQSAGSIAALLIGGAVWAFHWLYVARHDYESTLRQVYLYGYAILGSVITALIAVGIMVYGVLEWNIGVPESQSAASHFDFFPAAVASLILAGAILAYHSIVSAQELRASVTTPTGGRQSYPYVLAAVGLAMTAGAIIALASAVMDALIQGDHAIVFGGDLWRNGIVLAITAGILGVPLWGYYWASVQRRVRDEGPEARTLLARRAFIFAVLAVGMLAFLGSVSQALFVLISGVLETDMSNVLDDAKVSISILLAVGVFVPYHWMVYRTDRETAPTEPEKDYVKRKMVTVLVGGGGAEVQSGLERALHYSVKRLNLTAADAPMPELAESDYEELAAKIDRVTGDNVILVPEGTTFRVLPYT